MAQLIKVGNEIINLDNVTDIAFNRVPPGGNGRDDVHAVVVYFNVAIGSFGYAANGAGEWEVSSLTLNGQEAADFKVWLERKAEDVTSYADMMRSIKEAV